MSSADSKKTASILSPTASLDDSLVSMKTEDHNELYDHRQHVEFMPVKDDVNEMPEKKSRSNSMSAAMDPKMTRQVSFGSGNYKPDAILAKRSTDQFSGSRSQKSQNIINFNNDSDDDVSMPGPFFSKTTIQMSNARPSRLAHSIPHQEPLFQEKSDGDKSILLVDRRASKTHSFNTEMNRPKSANKTPKSRANSMSTMGSRPFKTLSKTLTNKSDGEQQAPQQTFNNLSGSKPRRASFDSENSQASRSSQETEEDVCFPMSPQLHTRVNGIDFDELEEFAVQINEQKNQMTSAMNNLQNNGFHEAPPMGHNPLQQQYSKDNAVFSLSSTPSSTAALKYSPKDEKMSLSSSFDNNSNNGGNRFHDTTAAAPPQGISFGHNKVEDDDDPRDIKHRNSIVFEKQPCGGQNAGNNDCGQFLCPNRFAFFCSESDETVHAQDIASLVKPGQSFYDLFRGGEQTWWLDCICPTDDEMRCIAKAFGIHPLTAEDIRMQETREKVEMFKPYYFVCFHTFENDKESEDYLEPINVYVVVFRTGVLTFHFGPISHCANVRRRVRQLRDYVDVNSDWLCYALIDDITDSFAPVIQSIEYEADTIEDFVFMARDMDFSLMLQKIGESRRKIMTLMRLLSGKADVIKMFAKRCQDEASGIGPALTSQINIANLQANGNFNGNLDKAVLDHNNLHVAQPRGEIALYLGDIYDHLVTMFQNLSSYEKIFSRSHSNYLAQLQVESFNSNNKVTEMLGKVTMIGTMLVPLNVITGLFGMNVKVPGEGGNIAWWFGILGVLIFLAICGWFLASYWVKRIDPPTTFSEADESGARSIITNLFPRGARGARNYNNADSRRRAFNPSSNRSVQSLPSKYSRYN